MKKLLAMMSLFLVASLSAQAATGNWMWLRVMRDDQQGWSIERGTSPMIIHGQDFTISLTRDHLPGTDIILRGRVTGNHVTAVETFEGTDASPWTWHGAIQKGRTPLTSPAGGSGEDRIWFYEDGSMIGLVRQVPPRDNPANTPGN